MNADQIAAVLAHPVSQELLTGPHLTRLSYSAKDGSPRVIPIGFLWNGTGIDMWTVPGSAKVSALAADPRVALTILSPGAVGKVMRPYLSITGTARIVEGGAPELLAQLAQTLAAPDSGFPPPDAPPGYLTRIRIDKVGGVGPWQD